MSINFTPLKTNNNSNSIKLNNTNYITNTSPNKEQNPSNNFNHFSAISDISGLKDNNFNNNLNSSNYNSPMKNLFSDCFLMRY